MATVRRATTADADALGHVHVAVWQAAYRGTMDDDFLDHLDADQRAGWWRDHLRPSSHDVGRVRDETWVLVEGGGLQGFVLFGDPNDDDRRGEPGVGQVHALNVRPDLWGERRGEVLLTTAEDGLVRRGARQGLLWVVAGNDRARRLYERRDWTADGARRTTRFGGRDVEEVRYLKGLAG